MSAEDRSRAPAAESGADPGAGNGAKRGDDPGAHDVYRVTHDPLDIGELVAAATTEPCGAVASFVGTVRSPNRGRAVVAIDYQGYDAMLLPLMREIAASLRERYDLHRLVLVHRLGVLRPGEASIAIVAATPHRDDAFAACRDALELCKERLPVWKLERHEEGDEWVAGVSRAAPTL